ncbi:MAG TPA: hypothetical protein VGA37_07990 [Gemmatimonadales bacterium]
MSETKDEVTQALEPEKLDLRSHDIAEDRREELLRLFPEIRTERGSSGAADYLAVPRSHLQRGSPATWA